MSFGHLKYEKKSIADTIRILGENDGPELMALPYDVDHSHDWPYGGGNSVDGRTIFIDQTLYREVMDGTVYVRGMTGRQIIRAWCRHERSEYAAEFGDNPSDDYVPSHEFATAYEHQGVADLAINTDRYEECIRDGLERCLKRFIKLGDKANPPRNAWCGPIIDDPDADDKEIIRILRAKGVADAFKKSKDSVGYGIGPEECRACAMYGSKDVHPNLRVCDKVCGLVRDTRHCELWAPKGK